MKKMKGSILLASYLLLLTFPSHALTRAEIVERFRAVPVVNTEGLVQVVADCPTDMRREYQLNVAGFVAETCRSLYAGEAARPRRFAEPGIVVHVGDMRTNVTNVVSRVRERADGTRYTKIYLPAPGYADMRALTLAVARAYFLAVHNEEVDDAKARQALVSANPELRAADTCARLADWSERGIYADGMDDEDYLKLSRKVLLPGRLTPHERDQFASRLFLYPLAYDAPFCGKYASLDFRTAIPLCRKDPSIRFAAFVKARQVVIFGAGRGDALKDAAAAYSEFLTELARAEKTEGELLALLATAEAKLRSLVSDNSCTQVNR